MNKNVLLIGLAALFLPACVKQQKLSDADARKIENKATLFKSYYSQELALLNASDSKFESEVVQIIVRKSNNYNDFVVGSFFIDSARRDSVGRPLVLYVDQLSSDIRSLKLNRLCDDDFKSRITCLADDLKQLHKRVKSLKAYKKASSKDKMMGIASWLLIPVVFLTTGIFTFSWSKKQHKKVRA